MEAGIAIILLFGVVLLIAWALSTIGEIKANVAEKNKKDFKAEIKKMEEVDKMYKDKLITEEERKKMRNKILGID